MRVYKAISLVLLIETICAVECGARPQEESPRLISSRIISSEREQAKQFDGLYKQKVVIENKMKFFKNYRANLQGLYGMGRVQKLEVMAERYENEKKSREIIEEEIKKLFALMESLDKLQRKTAEDKKLLALQRQIMDIKGLDESSMEVPATIDELFYYEVKSVATFREISALPEVYGDSDSWRFLFEANKDRFKDPMALIPKGTELVVPNIKVVEAIDISGEE